MTIIQLVFLFILIHQTSCDTSSDYSIQCPSRCDVLKEVDALRGEMQVIRQMLNQESLLRMNLDQQIYSQKIIIENLEKEVMVVNRTLLDNTEEIWSDLSAQADSLKNLDVNIDRTTQNLTKQFQLKEDIRKRELNDIRGTLAGIHIDLSAQADSLKTLDASMFVFNSSLDSTTQNLLREEGNRKRELNEMEGTLADIKQKILEFNHSISNQRTGNIAFSANGAKIRSGDITFESVSINLGGGYNNASGVFTVPSTGVYLFDWTVATNEKKKCKTALTLNGVRISVNFVESGASPEDSSGSQSIIRNLFKGDKVKISPYGTCSHIHYQWSSFSGLRYV